MNKLSSIANLIARMDPGAKKGTQRDDLDNYLMLVKAVIDDEIKTDASYADNNVTYFDFTFSVRPDWLMEDHDVKVNLAVSTEEPDWYVLMVVDCPDGELESWGNLTLTRSELEPVSCPVQYMLDRLHAMYSKKREESVKQYGQGLKEAADAIEPLLEQVRNVCKEHKVKLWFDRNIDGSNALMVLPEDAYADESGQTVDMDSVPYLDMGIVGFDSNYDIPRLPS